MKPHFNLGSVWTLEMPKRLNMAPASGELIAQWGRRQYSTIGV